MATDSPFTVYPALDAIYPASSLLAQAERWKELSDSFTSLYGTAPECVARAPGRINLIGEHIDYASFGVMPAAVEMDVLIAVSSSEATDGKPVISISNILPGWAKASIHPVRAGKVWDVGLDMKTMGWEGYVKAALSQVLDNFFQDESSTPRNLNLMVSGSIPPGSGLSSSAALIVSSLIAFIAGNKLISSTNITNSTLVQLASRSEALIGVNTGGMDQSASVLSSPSAGLYVSFYPKLGVESVPLPNLVGDDGKEEKAVLVIADSLAKHDLKLDATRHYNLRVVETLVAARALLQALGLTAQLGSTPDALNRRVTLREVVGLSVGEDVSKEVLSSESLESALEMTIKKVDQVFEKKDGYTRPEMAELSGMKVEDFNKVYLQYLEVEADKFQLYARTKHVLEEALRVLQFRRVCLASTSSSSSSFNTSIAQQLGKLMDESHASCRDLFDCASDELNSLVDVAKKAGAIGSRMSGAGWGGCSVHLLPASKVDAFIASVTGPDGYVNYQGVDKIRLKTVAFASIPGSGAGVLMME